MGFFKILFITLMIIMLFLAGFFFGFLGDKVQDQHYQELAIGTCKYANTLTGIINNQSATLELCINKELNYTRLENLNCSLLKGNNG